MKTAITFASIGFFFWAFWVTSEALNPFWQHVGWKAMISL
jgi:hypothetical protein